MKEVGIAVIGFGWMGKAHSRSYRRIPTLFPERLANPNLVYCVDQVEERREEAKRDFGFANVGADAEAAINHPDVDAVIICTPNMLHEELCIASAQAGKNVFCEKPVGGKPEQTVRVEQAARKADVISGVGYNYRWAPLVQYAKSLIADGVLGDITNYRGQFFSMYGSDPLGLLSWRFELEEAGYGASSDILSHAVDLGLMLNGPISEVVGQKATFITERPIAQPGAGGHYDRGKEGDPTGPVTNEDYAGLMARFANGSVGTFESSRNIVGPQSQMAFQVYGTEGAISWNLETMNEIKIFLKNQQHTHEGYTTVFSGDRFPKHGAFVPGDANPIGYEDLKTIECLNFLEAVATGEQHEPGFKEALNYVSLQEALIESWESGAWQKVVQLGV